MRRDAKLARPRLLTQDETQQLPPHKASMVRSAADSSGSVQAGWAWFERRQGVVAWGLRNLGTTESSVILVRNSYYFGDAYWSVYSANPTTFRTAFLDGGSRPPPLAETTLNLGAPPLGLVQFNGFQQAIVCFVFTLSPGQSWGMLEGGYQGGPPSGLGVYDVTPATSGEFCVGYDPQAVREFDDQTGTALDGYNPNPTTFDTWLFQAEPAAPYVKSFVGDSTAQGRCSQVMQEVPLPSPPIATEGGGGLFPSVFPDVLSPPLNP